MRKRRAAMIGLALGLAGVAGSLYVGVSVMGWLMDKARKVPAAPLRPAGRQVVGPASGAVGGLTARWVVSPARARPGQPFGVQVRYRNAGRRALALQEFTFAPIDAEVLDAGGRAIAPVFEAPPSDRRKIGWGTLTPGSSLTVPAGRAPTAAAVAANLEIGTRRWVLPPGRYEFRGTIRSKYFTPPGPMLRQRGVALWSGEIELPPVQIEVARRATQSAP